jgi:glyoxylase-like metal-dependent hydrolase (beta-lactamase superfamily II)
MMYHTKTINLSLPFKLGSVNCFLIKTDADFMLIDTGSSNARRELEQELLSIGCQPGNLKLIIITHGDFDHTGNAAYLREKFGAKIAMHPNDLPMAERGDMLANRKSTNFLNRMVAFLTPRLMGFNRSERFSHDLYLKDGDRLTEYGLEAEILSIPGHTQGSIGILTSNGDLFCGDLFENTTKPGLNTIMDDLAAAQASVEKLKGYAINTIYPGHGESFQMTFLQSK